MTLEQLIDKLAEIVPKGFWSEDENGQIILHTNLKCDDDDNVIDFGLPTDLAIAIQE